MSRIQVAIFELENTRVAIGGRSILKIGKFQFHRGTVYGIVGPVGAGKTTLLDLLAGRIIPTEGSILYEKEPFDKTWLGKIKVPAEIHFLNSEGGVTQDSVASFFRVRACTFVRRRCTSRARTGMRERCACWRRWAQR